jgi:hypothetical protein
MWISVVQFGLTRCIKACLHFRLLTVFQLPVIFACFTQKKNGISFHLLCLYATQTGSNIKFYTPAVHLHGPRSY